MVTENDSVSVGTAPKRQSIENQRLEQLGALSQEKLTLQPTITLEPLGTHGDSTEESAKINSLDGLLAELDAGDEQDPPIEEEITAIGKPQKIPDEYLHTDRAIGLSEREVIQRRRMYGWNQMKEANRSHIKQFLLFFVGPIQFVMEVNWSLKCPARGRC